MTDARSADNNVVAALPEMVASRGDARALVEAIPEKLMTWKPGEPIATRSVTWKELDAKVSAAAGGLRKMGLEAGDRAVIFVPMSIDLYVAMLAVFRLGAVSVFLDSFARQHQLGSCSSLVEPKAFIGNAIAQHFRPQLEPLADLPIQIVTGTRDKPNGSTPIDEIVEWGETAEIVAVQRETTALVTFTTGSSGVPKGANRTHRFLRAQHDALNLEIPYRDGDNDLPAFPIFLLNNLAAGITTTMPAVDLAVPADTDPIRLVSQVRDGGTSCTFSPAMLGRVSRYCIEEGVTLDGVWRCVTGGAPVGPDMVRDFRKAFPNAELAILYGSTEAEPICYITGSQMMSILEDPREAARQGVCVGRFAEGLHARLVRITRGPIERGDDGWKSWDVAAGEPGEVLVAGEHVCRDYYRNPEAVARNKIIDGDLVWHRTGDVGYQDEEGRLWLVGRVHNAIGREGKWFFPVEAEQVMKRLDFVKQPCFVGVPDDALGERTACVFSAEGGGGDAPVKAPAEQESAVRAALEKKGFVIDEVWVHPKIPMDPRHHSKVDYDQVRRSLLEATGMSADAAAATVAAHADQGGGDDPGAAGFGVNVEAE